VIRAHRMLLALAALGALLAGCEPNLEAITAPPPIGVAELDDDEGEIRISRGVALGFECTFQGSPCANAGTEIGDESIVSVRAAFLELLSEQGVGASSPGPQPRSAFVLVGLIEGTTTLLVTSSDGDTELDVTVVP
jgi:hypothetical protein